MRSLLLLLCCFALPLEASGDALQRCLDLAGRQEAVDLPKDCPKLFRELQDMGLQTSSEPPLTGKTAAAQLRFLLLSRQSIRSPASIREDGLEQLLAGILPPEAPNPEAEWWTTLMAWLDKLKSGDYEKQYRWLVEILRAVTPSGELVLALLYGAIALMVLVSAWLVLRELYFAGVFAKLPGVRLKPVRRSPKAGQAHISSATLQEIGALPPQRQIAALLDKVIADFAGRGIVPEDPTLTHRQLVRCIARHAPHIEAAFALLVRYAEPVLFGNRAASEETLRDCRRQVQLLLETR